MVQIPRGPDHLYCPFWRKRMSAVCHTCPQWVMIRGKDPQSNVDIDGWYCAASILPKLTIETAQQARQCGAATEAMRNEMIRLAERPRSSPPALASATQMMIESEQ